MVPCIVFIMMMGTVRGEQVSEGMPPDYSGTALKGFIQHLQSSDEYFRAYNELLRLRSYHPGYLNESEFCVSRSYFLLMGKQYFLCAYLYPSYSGNNALCQKALAVYSFDAGIYRGNRPGKDFFSSLPASSDDLFSRSLEKRRFMIYLLHGDYQAAYDIADPGDGGRKMYSALVDYAKVARQEKRSAVAALFCGVIPGGGYWYSGRKNTGIIAGVVVTLLSAVTYGAWVTDNRVIGIMTGTVAGFFYGGSVLGGYMAVKKHNRSVEENLAKYMTEELRLQHDAKEIYNRFGIGTRVK